MTALNATMMQALLMERVKFIELMLMNGFVMRNFINVETLRELYNDQVTIYNWDLMYKLKSFHLFDYFIVEKLQGNHQSAATNDQFQG
jgi:hypothetical protein